MRPPPFVSALLAHQRCKVAVPNAASHVSPQEIPPASRPPSRAAAWLVAVALAPAVARAEGEPKTISGQYSPYEQASIDQALATLGTGLDPQPEGKTVEGIDVVTFDVIEPRDPAPRILNV